MNKTNNPHSGLPTVVATQEIPATAEMIKVVLGPFHHDERPEFDVQVKGETPHGSLASNVDSIEHNNNYKVIYQFQNFGQVPVQVTIYRID